MNRVYYCDTHKRLVPVCENHIQMPGLIPGGRGLSTMGPVTVPEISNATQLNLLSSNVTTPSDSPQWTAPLCLKTPSEGELTS